MAQMKTPRCWPLIKRSRAWRELNGSARSVIVVPLKRFRSEEDLLGQKHPKDDTIELGGGYKLKHTDDASRLPGQELSNIRVVRQCIRRRCMRGLFVALLGPIAKRMSICPPVSPEGCASAT